MKNIFKVVFVIIGTLIGAGFASGQEMYIFFFSYGINGLIGILISSSLMGIVVYKALKIINKYNISNYKEFIEKIVPIDNKHKYLNLKNILNIIVNAFILITFFIMIAGFGAYFEQIIGLNSLIGSIILSFLCFIIFRKSVTGLVKSNQILIPILIILICIIGMLNIKEINILSLSDYLIKNNSFNWIVSSILYCSYNSILLIPTLITLKSYVKNKSSIRAISFISTIIIILLSIIIFLILVRVDVDIATLEMPAVYVVSRAFSKLEIVYGFIIVASIFTTSISLGTSFLQNTSKNKKSYTHIAFIMCITSVVVSKIGFSNLVNLLYPVFGYIGLFQIFALLLKKDCKIN